MKRSEHRRIEALLRRGAAGARVPLSSGMRDRVLAAIAPRPSRRAWLSIAAAALLLVVGAAWLARPRGPDTAPIAGGPRVSELAPRLAALGSLERASTVKLQQTLDQPLLGEVDRLARDSRSLGRFLLHRVPSFLVCVDEDSR